MSIAAERRRSNHELRQKIKKHGIMIHSVTEDGRIAFAYTTGMTDSGFPELAVRGFHYSLATKVAGVINFLFRNQKTGIPLEANHTVESHGLKMQAVEPDAIEQFKQDYMGLTTSYYGSLGRYDVLELVLLGEEIAAGSEEEGFAPVDDITRLKACAQCAKTSTTLDVGVKLLSCARCGRVKYCSRECQRSHWSSHKKACRPLDSPDGVNFASSGSPTSETVLNAAHPVVRRVLLVWSQQRKFGFIRFVDGDTRNCHASNLKRVSLRDALTHANWKVDWDMNLTPSDAGFVHEHRGLFALCEPQPACWAG